MKRYKNRQFHFAIIDMLLAILVFSVTMGVFYCFTEYRKASEKYNLEKTAVTHIIQTPGKEQVEEIKNMDFVQKVVPYYFSSCEVMADGKNAKADVYLIESIDDMPDTLFADALCVSVEEPIPANAIYIDTVFSRKYNISAGDEVGLVSGEKTLKCSVGGVYRADGRHDTGMLMAEYSGEIKAFIDPDNILKYSGAYLCGSDEAALDFYLCNYKPQGDLRSKDEFQSDELYQAYLNLRNETDYTQTIFYRSRYMKEIEKRYGASLQRNKMVIVGLLLAEIINLVIFPASRVRKYVKNGLLKDIRNNYKIGQEQEMFTMYFFAVGLMNLMTAAGGVIISWIIFDIDLSIIMCMTCLFLPLTATVVAWFIEKCKLHAKHGEIVEKS